MEMLVAGVVLLIISAVTGEAGQMHWGGVSVSSWAALAWLIIPGSVLGFTAYGYALAHLPLATMSTYAYVNPVVAVILGVLVLNERLTTREGLGALLVVASVALTLYRPACCRDRPGGSDHRAGNQLNHGNQHMAAQRMRTSACPCASSRCWDTF